MSKPKEEPKRDVIKSSAAIHIHNNITLLQRRVWNVLLFNARLSGREVKPIEFPDVKKTCPMITLGSSFECLACCP